MKQDANLKSAGAYEEYEKWRRYKVRATIISIVVGTTLLPLIWPAHVLFFEGFTDRNWQDVGAYFHWMGEVVTGGMHPIVFLNAYYGRWIVAVFQGAVPFPYMWVICPGIAVGTYIVLTGLNPHRNSPNIHGDTRWAKEEDIKKMSERDLIGFDKSLFVVGKFKNKILKMGETLSTLLLAPPGTGKSVGFIVPSAVSMDRASLFFHDQKPELFDMTSGHRAKLGPVYQLKWSAQDEPDGTWLTEDQAKLISPDLIEKDDNGEPVRSPEGLVRTKPIYYPSWNPLSPKCIPMPGPRRDLYIERLANVLCPDPSGGGDKFWTSKARAAMVGLVHYLVAKVEVASDPDLNGSWDGIPDHWHNREASFPMLVDWFAYAQNQFDDGSDDPMRQLFKVAIDECKTLEKKINEKFGIRAAMNRAIVELTNLMNSPDKTRGSILTTLDEAMNPFKNDAVRQRTSSSDFAFYELRGKPKPEAEAREMAKVAEAKKAGKIYKPRYARDEYMPISIYISVNLEDAKAFSVITGIFVDSANAYLTANGPNTIDDQGNQVGPFDFGFLLDEAPQLPKLDTVINGPSVGRSKRVFYVIVGQDFGQFEQKYSRPEVETLKSTTAIKIVLSQNNEATAQAISKMSGRITYNKFSYSEKSPPKGIAGLFKGPGKAVSESWDSTEFLKPSFIMSMPQDKHIVLVQNYMDRPILADTPKFFLQKDIAAKVYNLRTFEGPPPATPMPLEQMDEAAKRVARQLQEETKRDALQDPRCMVIATPADIQSLTRNSFGEMADRKDVFACAEIQVPNEDGFIDLPEENSILVTSDLKELAEFVGGRKYFVFDEKALEEEINSVLRGQGHPGLQPDLAQFLTRRIVEIGEEPSEDVYLLGYLGNASLDLPEDPNRVTPEFAIHWITDIINYIIGVEEQRKIFYEM
jgi:type IV secretory pathway TraG/TraD family ATPase VirD4